MGKYGYGFGDNALGGKHSVGHNGGFPGIAANFEMYPESGYTAVELMNADPPSLMPIAKAIRERIPAKYLSESAGVYPGFRQPLRLGANSCPADFSPKRRDPVAITC